MKKVLTFLGLFIFSSAVTQTLIRVNWPITFINLLSLLLDNIILFFFTFLISAPVTLIILKKIKFKDN
jgi:hypothetical protein